jgi:uncharacterized membrane protein
VTPPAVRRAAPAVPFLLALALFAVPRLALLTRYPPWQDELWTLDVLRRDFPTMLRWVVADQTHPPLYYALAWAWRRAGTDALWWMRLLSALIGIGTLIPLLALCRAARLELRATFLAVLLCAASPWLVFYALELRDYGLYAALATASLVAWLRARDAASHERLPWRVLAVVNIALVYSHYFGWLVIAAEGADALVSARGRIVPFLRSAAWTALAFIPWVGLVVRRAVRFPRGLDMVSWIERPAGGDLLDPFRAALGTSPWIGLDLALVVLSLGAIAWLLLRERGRPDSRVRVLSPLVLASLVPPALVFAASVAGPRSMWVPRYLLGVAPPFLVLLATAVSAALPARATALALSVALWPAALTTWHAARRDEKVAFDAIVREIGTPDAGRETAPVYALDYVEGGPLAWAAANDAPAGVPRLAVATLPSLDSLAAPRAWVVWNASRPPAGPPPPARLVRRGYRVDREFFVRGMGDSVVAIAVRRTR